jgi:hypothetical protein
MAHSLNPVAALIARVTELLKPPLRIDRVSDGRPHQWLIDRDDNPHEFAAYLSLEEDEEDPEILKVVPTADGGGPGEYHEDPGYVEIHHGEDAAEAIMALAESYLTDGPARDPQWWLAAGRGRFDGPHPVTPIGIVAAHARATRPDLDVGWREEESTLVISLDLGGNYLEVTDLSDVEDERSCDHVRVHTYYVNDSDPDSEGLRSTCCEFDVDAPGFYAQLDAKLAEVFGAAP